MSYSGYSRAVYGGYTPLTGAPQVEPGVGADWGAAAAWGHAPTATTSAAELPEVSYYYRYPDEAGEYAPSAAEYWGDTAVGGYEYEPAPYPSASAPYPGRAAWGDVPAYYTTTTTTGGGGGYARGHAFPYEAEFDDYADYADYADYGPVRHPAPRAIPPARRFASPSAGVRRYSATSGPPPAYRDTYDRFEDPEWGRRPPAISPARTRPPLRRNRSILDEEEPQWPVTRYAAAARAPAPRSASRDRYGAAATAAGGEGGYGAPLPRRSPARSRILPEDEELGASAAFLSRRARSPKRLEYDDQVRSGAAYRSSSAPRPAAGGYGGYGGSAPPAYPPQRGSSRYTPEYYDTIQRTDSSSSSSSSEDEDEDPRHHAGRNLHRPPAYPTTSKPLGKPQRGALKQSRQPAAAPAPDHHYGGGGYGHQQSYPRQEEDDDDEDEEDEEEAQPPAQVWERHGGVEQPQHQAQQNYQPPPPPQYPPPQRQSPPSPPSPPQDQHHHHPHHQGPPPPPPQHAQNSPPQHGSRPPPDLAGNLSPTDQHKLGARRVYENYLIRIPPGTPRRLILCHGRKHKPEFEHSIHVDKDPAVGPDYVCDLTDPVVLRELADESFDSIVLAYPPRWLFFQETAGNPPAALWREIFRLLSPKGYVVALGLYEAFYNRDLPLLQQQKQQQKKKKGNGLFGGKKQQQPAANTINKDQLEPLVATHVKQFLASTGFTRTSFPNREPNPRPLRELHVLPPADVVVVGEK